MTPPLGSGAATAIVRLRIALVRRQADRLAHLRRRLVLAQALVDHLAQQIVVGPGEILHFGDQAQAAPNARG